MIQRVSRIKENGDESRREDRCKYYADLGILILPFTTSFRKLKTNREFNQVLLQLKHYV